MKLLIVPALSALLFAGLAPAADASARPVLQLARNDRGGEHPSPGGAQPSPATAPVGAVDNGPPASDSGRGHGRNNGDTGGATGGATTGVDPTAGGILTGGTGRPSGRTGGHTPRGQGTGAPTGGTMGPATTGSPLTGAPTGRTGGANSTRGHGPNGPATTGGAMGGPFTGAPTGRGTGGATNTGGRNGANVFGTRPPNWNRFPRTFDRGTYQRNFTAPRRFHWQSYRRPQGWYKRRWAFGQVLPSIFWANDYWLNDYWMFDLPIPPYGYVWVRYGDDALLVNRRTGRVLQVVYGLFD